MGNLPIGQGIAVTPMQMATAYAAIANGGILRPPHIVRRVDGKLVAAPARAARDLRRHRAPSCARCSRACFAPGGTASEVSIPGYELAGKTGTANKIDPTTGEYSDSRYVASFVGFAPAPHPQAADRRDGRRAAGRTIYGGSVAAPAFGKIASFALALSAHRAVSEGADTPRGVDASLLSRMLLCEVMGRAAPPVEVTALAYDSARRGARDAVLLRARLHARRSRLRAARRSTRGAVALVVERPLGLGVPEVRRRRRARRDGAGRGGARRRPDRAAATSSASPAPTARPRRPSWCARCSQAGGHATGLLGTVTRRSSAACSSAVARTTPEAIDLQRDVRGDARRPATTRASMEVSSPRAGAAPRRRDPLVGRGLHQPHPGPPRLPRRHGGLLPAKRRLFEAGPRASRSSTSTTPTGAGSRREFPGAITRRARERRRGSYGATDVERRRRPARRSRVGGLRAAHAAARPLQRAQRARRGRRGARAGRRRRGDRRRPGAAPSGCPGASSRSTRARTSRCSSTTPTRPTRWRTCCAPRARLTDGRADRASSAPAATATAASAR